jgi:hypothetical protein
MNQTVGTCSICGGPVTVPLAWLGIHPPSPSCGRCGAVAAQHGPVIPMVPAQTFQIPTPFVMDEVSTGPWITWEATSVSIAPDGDLETITWETS